jgi:HEAT repeats
MRATGWYTTTLAAGAFLLGTIAAGSGTLAGAWEPIARFVRLQDAPRAASANVLSEHEIAALSEMPPQSQAELLLERSINHYAGANDQIAARVNGWRGRIALNDRLNNLFVTAINSGDLTVRVAGIEIDVAARNLTKNSSTIDRLEPIARFGEQGPRVNALWDMALLGNRGVDPNRVADILLLSLRDENVNIRYWAVEGLAYLATDAAIAPLLDVFHDDPSPMIRERAACGLAQSGMFSAAQRRTAVPRLLDFAGDGGLDPDTRTWVFQALRDITGESLPHDALLWRRWYAAKPEREPPD